MEREKKKDLLGRFVEIKAGSDEFMAFLGALDQILPFAGYEIDDIGERLALMPTQWRRVMQYGLGFAQTLISGTVRPLDGYLKVTVLAAQYFCLGQTVGHRQRCQKHCLPVANPW